ncbi:hypothetical protein PPYR_14365 [Photinus pyralis]|uniref:DUF3421 domain-containing protein n=2 Tax=Photinus pyralis TaxID=7054 RepID=A0A5N4A4Z7_PHOPY|nr:uncharacterized protein LOC116180923 [Photinus pyralis]KAB0792406.1 hypothetical protein PPYR_14365 [Photinus pyralis]
MFLILTFTVLNIFLAHASSATGYFWRDFDGFVPPDAFVAARDEYNNPIYIGQALHKDYLVPAKILHNDRAAYYEYGGWAYETKDNLKIFCTKEPEQFEWIYTSVKNLNTITGQFLVIGGYESAKSTIYIGRTKSAGLVLIGKVVADSSSEALYVAQNGKSHSYTSYEVLSYKEKDKNQQHTTSVVKTVDQNVLN